MFTLLVDGDCIDIIEEWAKGFKMELKKVSDVYDRDNLKPKTLIDFCKDNNYNAVLSSSIDGFEGQSLVILDDTNSNAVLPNNDTINLHVYSESIYNGFKSTESYYTIKSISYMYGILEKIESIYSLEHQSQVSNVSEIVKVKDNRKTSDNINNILKKKSKKRKKQR